MLDAALEGFGLTYLTPTGRAASRKRASWSVSLPTGTHPSPVITSIIQAAGSRRRHSRCRLGALHYRATSKACGAVVALTRHFG
jgi:hypothetical protein